MKIAIVGLGYWGKNLVRVLNSLKVLDSCFDLDENILNKYISDVSYRDVAFGTDWEIVLNNPDIKGVVVATPPSSHFNIAKKVLESGKHVFVEKPMTLDVEESKILVEIASRKKLILMVGHIFIYSNEILKLKEIITNPNFGNVSYIYTRRLNLGLVQRCGVVQDLAAHDISIINYLLDDTCKAVSVNALSHILENVDDVAFVNMKYSRTNANLHLSWLDPLKIRDTVVVGTNQMAVCDSGQKKIDVYNKRVEVDSSNESYAHHVMSYKYGDVISPYIVPSEPLTVELQAFIDSINNNTTPLASGEVGLEVVKTLAAMKKSMENNGSWVDVV